MDARILHAIAALRAAVDLSDEPEQHLGITTRSGAVLRSRTPDLPAENAVSSSLILFRCRASQQDPSCIASTAGATRGTLVHPGRYRPIDPGAHDASQSGTFS